MVEQNSSTKIPWAEYSNSSISVYASGNDTDEELYDIPAGLIALLSVFYGSISVLAVVGNSLVIWIVLTSRRMQNVTNCFIANLALADIVIGLFAIPFQFQAALLQRWNLPHFMCPFCPFVQVLTVNVSIFTLIAIAIDRYRAILNPFRARLSKLRAKIIIAVIWIASTILASPVSIALRVTMVVDDPVKNHSKPFCQNVHLSPEAMRTYRWVLVFVQYLTPVCVISFVYARIALKLWGNKAPGNAENTRDAALMKNKKKVIKMLVIVVILFDICWLPWQIYNFLQEVYEEINGYRYINIIYFVCDWLAMSNSCYNPFIYGIYNEKFKREFQLRFPFRGRNWTPSPPADDSADDKNLSVHTRMSSFRSNYDWRHSYSSRHSNTIANNTVNSTPSFYRGIAVRQPSFRHSTPGANGIQTELYVFPAKSPAKHISANDLDL